MSLLAVAGANSAVAGGYDIDNSLKLEADNSERLYFTPSSSGNRKTWTFSCWFKRTEADKYCMLMGSADTYMYIDQYGGDMHIRLNGSNYLYTTPQYKDSSAWYHFVLAVDTTQATAANRAKFYVNGEQVTAFATEVYPSQNLDTSWNFTNAHYIGGWTSTLYDSSGYIAEVHSVDGQQLAPTDFGEFDADTGIWKPIEYTGTYGTNGFYLEFKNSADLGDDTSGNNKNFVLSNITSADQATDTPTNNFAILNPLFKYPSSQVITEGATEVTRTSGSGLNKTFLVTIPVNNGKWYAEFEPAASSNYVVGIMPDSTAASVAMDANYLGNSAYAESISYYSNTGVKIVAPSGGSTYGDSWTTGDTIGIALDMDNNYVYFSKNGTWQNSGDPTSGATGTGGIALTNTTDGHLIGFTYDTGGNMYCNFGGYTVSSLASAASDANGYGTFEYAPPSGYYALCSKNLAEFG